jgi:hypothetical protein
MRVSALRRWHWILIALVVGLGGGSIRQATLDFEDQLDGYGKLIVSQRQFEEALVGQVEGIRQFKDITVYPYVIHSTNGTKRLVHIVTGHYWNGEPVMDHGQLKARFVPSCYLATMPYRPLNGGSAGTVLDYLDQMRKTANVQYRYAWWWWAVTPASLWVIGSLLLIGGVWPTVINLIAFGSLGRPKEEKGVSLLHVKAPPRAQPVAASVDASHLANLEMELEERLAGGANATDDPQPAAPVPKTLAGGPLEPVALPTAQDDREFGADKDDFYPTERHRPHQPHP